MQQVRGVVARSAGAPVELVTIDVPDPGPGEALVRVQASEGRRGENAVTGRPARRPRESNGMRRTEHSRDRFQRENSPLCPGFQRENRDFPSCNWETMPYFGCGRLPPYSA